jgi:hypothetical protein
MPPPLVFFKTVFSTSPENFVLVTQKARFDAFFELRPPTKKRHVEFKSGC